MISSLYASKLKLPLFIIAILSIVWAGFLPKILAILLLIPIAVLTILSLLNIFLGDKDMRLLSIVGTVCLLVMSFSLFKQGFASTPTSTTPSAVDQKIIQTYQPSFTNLTTKPQAANSKQVFLTGTLAIKNPSKKPTTLIVSVEARVKDKLIAIGSWRVQVPATGFSQIETLQTTPQFIASDVSNAKVTFTTVKTDTATTSSSQQSSSTSQSSVSKK